MCFDSSDAGDHNSRKMTGCSSIWSRRLSYLGWQGDSILRARRLILRGFRVSGQARLRTPSGRGRSAAEVSEMIALEHLVVGGGAIRTRSGPYLESWPKIVLFVAGIAVLGGVVAIWNRSHYHP